MRQPGESITEAPNSRFPAGCAPRALRRQKAEDGSTLVEFAIIFIMFMTMILGIAGFGHALYAYHFVNHAAKEASRWAAVNGSTCNADNSCNGTAPMNNGPANATDIQAFVTKITPLGIDSSKVTVTTTWPTVTGSPQICSTAVGGVGPTINYPGCTVQVTVSYPFTFIFPLLPTNPLTLSSTSEMVIAH